MKISGIAKDNNVASISVEGVPDEPGISFKVFRALAKAKINVDIILQSVERGGANDISFTVAKADLAAATNIMEDLMETIGFNKVTVDNTVAKVSIVGAGMVSASGIAALMFEALYDAKVNIKMISTSEIKISVLIDEEHVDAAVQAIHNKFFGD